MQCIQHHGHLNISTHHCINCSKTGFVPTLNLSHQNRLCIGTKPAFSFWINMSTASEVRSDCQGLGLVARIEASILVFDTIQVLYWPVLGQIQFCSFDRRCKTCLDTKPVLYQDRFCSLTTVSYLDQKLMQISSTPMPLRLIWNKGQLWQQPECAWTASTNISTRRALLFDTVKVYQTENIDMKWYLFWLCGDIWYARTCKQKISDVNFSPC